MACKSPLRRFRRGFVIYLVVTALALMMAVAGFLLRDMRHRDVWTNRHGSGEQALALADAAVSDVLHAARGALTPLYEEGRDPNEGPLSVFLLQDSAGIRRAMDALGSRPEAHRVFLGKMLGKCALEPSTRILQRVPGARVDVTVGFEVEDLHAALREGKPIHRRYQDGVEKLVRMRVTASAAVGPAVRTVWVEKPLKVYSMLLPVTPRFTAFSFAGGDPNDLSNDPSGRPVEAGDPGPTVLYHSGECLAGAATSASQDRPGWLFFGEQPTHFRLTSGRQDYHLSSTAESPKARAVDNPPPGVEGASPPDGVNPGVRHALAVQAAFWGYYKGMDPLGLFGEDFDDRSSRLHLFGTQSEPSPAKIFGPVHQDLALYTALAIDRDASGDDEAEQAAACCVLPVREARDPFFRLIGRTPYEADVILERSGLPPASLIPFSSPGMPPYRVENLNARVDLDGDGVRETFVSSEKEHAVLRLDPEHYQYGLLFGRHEDYDPWSCREVSWPHDAIPELMALDAETSFRRLSSEFLPFRGGVPQTGAALDPRDLKLPYADSLHAGLEGDASRQPHFDNSVEPEEELEEFQLLSLVEARAAARISAEEFVSRFLKPLAGGGFVLDAQERCVQVEGTLEIPDGTRILQGGLILAPSVSFGGSALQEGLFSPLSVAAGGISAAPGSVIQGSLYGQGFGKSDGMTLLGTVAAGSLPALTALRGGRICYDPGYDPTGPLAPRFYRSDMGDVALDAGLEYR